VRTLLRNKREFYYALYLGDEPVLVNGQRTGEHHACYSEPIFCLANISPATGAVAYRLFGTSLEYDSVITTDDTAIPIDEFSYLWIYADPDQAPDYTVKRIAKSLNSVAIAISKTNVSRVKTDD